MYCSFSKIHKMIAMCIYIALIYFIPMAKGAIPGTFFWRPRLGLDLSIPTPEPTGRVALLNKQNIRDGLVVVVDGFKVGVALVAITTSICTGSPYLNPTSAYFYTNMYRWALRHISFLPLWVAGSSGQYCETHKLWKRRFTYMDNFIPPWLQSALFFVKKEEWEQVALDHEKFKQYSEPAFSEHYKFPPKK